MFYPKTTLFSKAPATFHVKNEDMWRKVLYIMILSCVSSVLSAQENGSSDAVLEFLGILNPEDADPYEVERLSVYMARPLKINLESVSSLMSSGLFSSYQAASLRDYRARHGDVLSLTELASVDGFDPLFVRRLAPFVSLYSPVVPGKRIREGFSMTNDLLMRANALNGTYGFKYKAGICERAGLGVSASRSSSARTPAPDSYSAFISYDCANYPIRVVVGDFNARFGQGLALWNGMALSGLSAPASFFRNPSGISTSSSFSGTYALTGLAAEASLRRMTFSVMTVMPGFKHISERLDDVTVLPAFNLTWIGKSSRLGLTQYAEFSGLFSETVARIPDMKTSVDASMCIRGTDFFGEAAFDWVNCSVAALAGTRFPAGENLRMSVLLRWYPSDFESGRSAAPRAGTGCTNEYGAAFGGEFGTSDGRHNGSFSTDVCYYPESKSDGMTSVQVKAVCVWNVLLSDLLELRFRFSERFRTWQTPFRTDLRADIRWNTGRFSVSARMNLLQCMSTGLLAYMEGGYAHRGLSLYLRQGIFRIDNWDDRIYVYERDAQGSFNVPAFYGRGIWTSAVGTWKFARWGKVNVRSSFTSYPFMKEKKSGRAELKFQFTFSF